MIPAAATVLPLPNYVCHPLHAPSQQYAPRISYTALSTVAIAHTAFLAQFAQIAEISGQTVSQKHMPTSGNPNFPAKSKTAQSANLICGMRRVRSFSKKIQQDKKLRDPQKFGIAAVVSKKIGNIC